MLICADNLIAEGMVTKGNLLSQRMHKLFVDLKGFKMQCRIIACIIHVSSARMIKQRTNSVS